MSITSELLFYSREKTGVVRETYDERVCGIFRNINLVLMPSVERQETYDKGACVCT